MGSRRSVETDVVVMVELSVSGLSGGSAVVDTGGDRDSRAGFLDALSSVPPGVPFSVASSLVARNSTISSRTGEGQGTCCG